MKKKLFLTISVIILAMSIFSFEALAKKKVRKGVTAQGAMLVDVKNDRVLFSKNIHERFEPASTAKIMTALLVVENLDLNSFVPASPRACSMEPSKIHLKCAVKYKVKDLLHAILMSSANDASTCLAEAISGTENKFAALMNKRARELGCKNTKFTTASGLPSKARQYTTAYDLTQIMRKLVTYPLIVEIMQKKSYSFKDSEGNTKKLSNHNKYLWKYPGKVIGKTGFTIKAKHCFVGNDLVKGKEVVFAILKSVSLWPDVKYLLQLAGCIN